MTATLPSPELVSRVCTAAATAALAETRGAQWYDLLAGILLVKSGVELMSMNGKTPPEIAAWLRMQAQAIEQTPAAMFGPVKGNA